MAISGLWHGAASTFILWGVYHGVLLLVERLWLGTAAYRSFREKTPEPAFRSVAVAGMYLATVVGWLFFRAQSWHGLTSYLDALLAGTGTQELLYPKSAFLSVLACFAIQCLDFSKIPTRREESAWMGLRASCTAASRRMLGAHTDWLRPVFIAAMLVIGLVSTFFFRAPGDTPQFIYFQF